MERPRTVPITVPITVPKTVPNNVPKTVPNTVPKTAPKTDPKLFVLVFLRKCTQTVLDASIGIVFWIWVSWLCFVSWF